VTTIPERPDQPAVRVLPPDEALAAAWPLPPREQFVLDDIPDDEWQAFLEALADA
jgi:hypothetical protein